MTAATASNHLSIVTGSSRGLGAAFVGQLLQPGHVLLGIARGDNPALQARANAAGVVLTQWRADLADPQQDLGALEADVRAAVQERHQRSRRGRAAHAPKPEPGEP